MVLKLTTIFLILFSMRSFSEGNLLKDIANEEIQEHVLPYIEGLLDAKALSNLQEFIKKDGCAEKYIAKHQQHFDEGKPIKCKKSKSPIFSNKDDFDMLKVSVIANFEELNQERNSHNGVARIQDGDRVETIPLNISARGNSRGSWCEWKPQRWSFLSKESLTSLNSKISAQAENENDNNYLKRFYKSMNQDHLDLINKDGKKDRDNIFGKIGDDIKLVTHCGYAAKYPNWLGGKTDEAQKERVLSEFVVYQMLDEMKSTVIKTRLAEITYLSPDGKVLKTSYGFFREPRGALAKRCGLLDLRSDKVKVEGTNKASDFQIDLFNKFVFSQDYRKSGHNVHVLKNQIGERVFGPYDYDLSQIFTDAYIKDEATRKETGISDMRLLLDSNFGNPTGIVQVYAFKRKIEKMKDILERSPLQEERKEVFREWIALMDKELVSYLNRSKLNHPELLESLITKDIIGKQKEAKK